jgi:hypothetical protein
MLTRILLITGLLAASFSASARDFEDSYAVYGAGGDNCSTYLEAMEKGGKELDYFVDWVVGYFSAFNVIMPNTYDLLGETDFPTAQRWLERDCQRYPRQLFITAVIKLTETLYPMRYQSGLKQGAIGGTPADKVPTAAEKAPAASQ